MREITIHKPAAIGKSTMQPFTVSGSLTMTFADPRLFEHYVSARQAGKRTLQRAWLQYLSTAPKALPRPPLLTRAVRFALEHWHA
jgi:hypothetical protein